MSDERSGSDDRGPLAGLDTEFTIDGEVVDLSDNEGPELTTNVDDWLAGSSASRSDGEAVEGTTRDPRAAPGLATDPPYGAAVPNRLADAVSPYLRSHADNPVDWYPWGAEAFEAAARRDVPVLVSIGYATCHWCHVMARESFSDPDARRGPERALRGDQGRPRGASRGRCGLPRRGRRLHAEPRLAAERLRDAVRPRLPRRHLLAADARRGEPVVPAGARGGAGRLDDPARRGGAVRRRPRGGARRGGGHVGGGRGSAVAGRLRRRRRGARRLRGPHLRRLRRRAEVPRRAGPEHGAGARPLAAARGGGARADPRGRDARARRDAGRRPARPGRGRLLPLRHPPRLERAALRADAHRQRAAAPGLRRDRRSGDRGRHRRVPRRACCGGRRGRSARRRTPRACSTGSGTRAATTASTRRRAAQVDPPAVDGKVLTGWNGLAIAGLADAAAALGEPEWLRLATDAADAVLALHRTADGLLRASLDGRPSTAVATLEDWGGLADGLLALAVATGRADLAVAGREPRRRLPRRRPLRRARRRRPGARRAGRGRRRGPGGGGVPVGHDR